MIITPKLEYYQNYFNIKCIIIKDQNNNCMNYLKLYSNSWKILFDCIKDINLMEKIIEFNYDKCNNYGNGNNDDNYKDINIIITDEKLIQLAKSCKILFYEILQQNKNSLKIKFFGNKDNINLIENHIKEYFKS